MAYATRLIRALGPFELDPCAPVVRPWPTANHHFTILDDGLSQQWFGRVWLNPPYGPHTGTWLERLAKHGNGVGLVFARTETRTWFDWIWNAADAVLFLEAELLPRRGESGSEKLRRSFFQQAASVPLLK